MKKSLFIILALFPMFLYAQVLTGRAVSIIDGDTFILLINGNEQIKIRLDGIDAPEKSQDFGSRAKEYLSEMIWDQELTVNVTKKDRYGRSIGKISTPTIEDVNIEMIKAGLAWHYKEYNHDKTYADAEILARKNKKGLWIYKNPIKPQDFRRHKNR